MADSEKDAADQLPPKPHRNGGIPARVYYGVLAAVYFVLTIVGLVALGSFGVTEAQVRNYVVSNNVANPERNCILYSAHRGTDVVPGVYRRIAIGQAGPCGFILWSDVSAVIVLLVWMVYNIVLLVLGKNM